jgi:hypothetical protein
MSSDGACRWGNQPTADSPSLSTGSSIRKTGREQSKSRGVEILSDCFKITCGISGFPGQKTRRNAGFATAK